MYVKLSEVTLIHKSQYRRPPGHEEYEDRPVYERELNGERVFTFDAELTKYDPREPVRYGVGYDAPSFSEDRPRFVVVPDVWNPDDAMCARDAVHPVWPVFNTEHYNGELVVHNGVVYKDVRNGQAYSQYEAIEINGQMYASTAYTFLAGPVAAEDDLPPYQDVRDIMYEFRVRDLDSRWYLVTDPTWQKD